MKLPTAATNFYCSGNRARINSILQSGMIPMTNWNTFKKELTFELGRFLHRKIRAHFDFVDSSCTRQQQVFVNIDNLLLKEDQVLHDKCMVYVVIFSSNVCSKICLVAAETANISVQLYEEIIGGIKTVGNLDQMQKSEEAVYTANYGSGPNRRRSRPSLKKRKTSMIPSVVQEATPAPQAQLLSILYFHASASPLSYRILTSLFCSQLEGL